MRVYTYLMMGVAEVLGILPYQRSNTTVSSPWKIWEAGKLPIFPLHASFPTTDISALLTLPHIPGYLGFKVMLCVQSKQKKVEYQQSFIKQLMGFYSAGTSELGWESPTPCTHTAGYVSQSFLFQVGTGKDTESSGNRWRQHVGQG